MQYRIHEPTEDSDLIPPAEATMYVVTVHSTDRVESLERFESRFPDASERDRELVRRLFLLNKNTILNVIQLVG